MSLISQPMTEIRGVSKLRWTSGPPVVVSKVAFTTTGLYGGTSLSVKTHQKPGNMMAGMMLPGYIFDELFFSS